MSKEFDFGSMDEGGKPEIPEIDVADIMEKVTKEIDARIKKLLPSIKPAAQKIDNSQIKEIVDNAINEQMNSAIEHATSEFSGRLDGFMEKVNGMVATYKQNIQELWKEIYPVLVKMWGSSKGIGKKIAMMDSIISGKE